MPRGAATVYRGAIGQTRVERVLYSCACGTVKPVEVYRCVNASTHPDLAARMRRSAVNTVSCPDRPAEPVNVSVVYHDPEQQAFALVIPECLRHTELAERSDLLVRMAGDRDHELPAYVRDFTIVFGADELVDYLDGLAQLSARELRARELEQELAQRKALLEREEQAFAAQKTEFERVVAELEQRNRALQNRVAELDRRAEELAISEPPDVPEPAPVTASLLPVSRDPDLTPLPRPVPHEEIHTNPVELLSPAEISELMHAGADPVIVAHQRATIDAVIEEEQTGSLISPDQIVAEEDSKPRARPLTDEDATTVGGATDVAVERWIISREPELKYADEQGVRLAASATVEELAALLGDEIDLKVQLHRLPSFPLIVLAIGVPSGHLAPFCFLFDVTSENDRGVLSALAREFTFELHLYDREYLPVQRRQVRANLADNVRFALTAAEEHLSAIPVDQRSYNRAHIAWTAPNFDRHGRHRVERALYRPQLFERLDTAARVAEALEMVAACSAPEREEVLILVLGEPLLRWNQQRGKVVLKAVEHGLWPGAQLARLAVSAGAARSRKDLVQRLLSAFARTAADGASGLAPKAVEENWAALREQANQLGLGLEPAAPVDVVSGTIGGDDDELATALQAPIPPRSNGTQARISALDGATRDELLAMLRDKRRRCDAAVQLCKRADERAVGPIFEVVGAMTRAEAVKVLSNSIKLGDVALHPLLRTLRSGKGFLRHGSALALGALGDEAGIEAVCDQLLAEPTEIWRELARSVGQVGRSAVMSLVARLRGQDEAGRERIAWALAMIAARDGADEVLTLAEGRDPIAAGVARHALELSTMARSDDAAVRGPATPRDQTVNRAFSRKFFEAMNRDDVATDDDDALLLDEADLIEADAEILDESDLIPT